MKSRIIYSCLLTAFYALIDGAFIGATLADQPTRFEPLLWGASHRHRWPHVLPGAELAKVPSTSAEHDCHRGLLRHLCDHCNAPCGLAVTDAASMRGCFPTFSPDACLVEGPSERRLDQRRSRKISGHEITPHLNKGEGFCGAGGN